MVVSAAQDTCRSVDVIITTDELIGLTKVTRAPVDRRCINTTCVEVFDVGRYVVWTVYTLDHNVLQQSNKIYVTRDGYTGWPKNGTFFSYALTSSDINRFKTLFHGQNQERICNNSITKDPTTPQVHRYTTL